LPRTLTDSVVVITGASSGIGRAAAQAFAREGARLVLTSRAEEPLRAVIADCERAGATAVAVPADVRDEAAVQRVAAVAVERFGGLHTWVNAAGVMAYGRFEEIPAEVFRAVVDTNFLGQVHGARAALPRFRAQGDGVLINVASVWGRITSPEVSPYVASKFAVRAFSACLRQELRHEPGIHVTVIAPQAVDTPIFENAGNYAGRPARPVPPLVDPDEVATGIVRCARDPRPEVTYRRAGRLLEVFHAVSPRLYDRLLPPAFEAGNYGEGQAAPGPGNVLEAVPADRSVTGGWKRDRRRELARAFLATSRGMLRGVRGG